MKKYFTPISRSSGLYLSRAWESPDTARFVKVFRETWSRLPYADRRALVKRWREQSAAIGSQIYVGRQPTADEMRQLSQTPVIEYSHFPRSTRGEVDRLGEFATGNVKHGMRDSFYFWRPVVEIMDDETLSTLIAHELAHAVLACYGFPVAILERPATPEEREWEEERVGELLSEWDFLDCQTWGLGPIVQFNHDNREKLDALSAEYHDAE